MDIDPPSVSRPGDYEYVFPAIRGVQARRQYYVTMWPLRLIPKLFLFDSEELPPEMRAQRTLNRARVPEMARYIVENPDSYIFSALTASVNADVRFEPMVSDGSSADRVGKLTIPMDARFVINDGQHRRAAIARALEENTDLSDETIAIVLFIDVGLSRSQQMFADLNRHAIRPSRSIGVLYDHRDPMSEVAKQAVLRSALYSDLTEMETSNLAARSRKLFTLSAFYTADRALLEDITMDGLDESIDLVTSYWERVGKQFPTWNQVHEGKVSAGEVRKDFIHSHGIVLHALGKVGNALLRSSRSPARWERELKKLGDVDWHRSNSAVWEGRATIGGKVSKGASNVLLTTAYIRGVLGMPLPPEEQSADEAFARGEKK
ncbi:MAG TPA: DNA sulfur modification protein DndB [Propionibacteriaceae bacterium]|nr:DNA sulfur modification protein DndB [Propionibacteriaceae bacterium]